MKNKQTLCQFLNIKLEKGQPFIITHYGNEVYREYAAGFWSKNEYDDKGNRTYIEHSEGYWWKNKYDLNDKQTYYEDSDGYWWRAEYDAEGRDIYYEDSKGFWLKTEYDTNGKMIYREDSNGYIYDKRPKELTLDEIADKFGIPVDQLKIKKD